MGQAPGGAAFVGSAPATVANVGSGFDVIGLALSGPRDEVRASAALPGPGGSGVTVRSVTGDGGRLPLDAGSNTAGVAVLSYLSEVGTRPFEIVLDVTKGLPLGSGLGSSAASAAAAVVAADALCGGLLPRASLVRHAAEGERAASGTPHADNVAPALLGGFVLVRSYDPLALETLGSPPDLCCVVACPAAEVRTADARRVVPRDVPLRDVVLQLGAFGTLVAGVVKGDVPLLLRGLTDRLAEPYRTPLIPGWEAAAAAVSAAGFPGGLHVSGSGPSVFVLTDGPDEARRAAGVLAGAFGSAGVDAAVHVSPVDPVGATVTRREEGD